MRIIKLRVWDGKRMLFMGKGGYCDFEIAGGEIFVCGTFDLVKKDFPLMQFTGLQDKNGVDIYDGDIVKFKSFIETVKYDAEYGFTPLQVPCDYDEIMPCMSDVEVLGSIHQNPELLEASK